MIDAANLIAAARQLNTGRDGAPPDREAVRRAVSTAYYALFHALVKDATERFIGANNTSAAFETIYRGFNHGDINRVFAAVDKQVLGGAYKKRLRRDAVSQEIREVATVFVALQEYRHLADYSPFFQVGQLEATGMIDLADAAIETLANADRQEKADLFAIMLAGTRAT